MATSIENKISILSELWQQYKNEPAWLDFFDYNDIGLPMAFMLEEKIVKETEVGIRYIDETFELLVRTLEFDEDLEWDNLQAMFDDSDKLWGDNE